MAYVLAEFGDSARPGDVYVTNDPYGAGGQHLPDIYVVKPIFVDGALEGWAATMAHHADIGGIAPGSIAVHATEIFQEGLRIPLLKLVDEGRENETLLKILAKNTRQPTAVLGDVRAQLAACRAGERGLAELIARYGVPTVRAASDELQALGERLMRAGIAALPDGEASFLDHIDGFGEDPEPIAIAATVRIAGDTMEIDFAGTSPQVDASLNCPVGMIAAACYCVVRGVVGVDMPNCEGTMRPISVLAPDGTVVNPVLPAACGARGVIGYRVYDAVMGALGRLVPDRVIAACEGGPTLIAFGGTHGGEPFVTTEVIVGAWGAGADRDGLEGVSNPLANLSNQPVELIEADLPLEVTRYGLVPDSGGAGRQRGGLAFERAFRVLADRAVLTIRSDRRLHRPYGVDGGEPGGASDNILVTADGERRLPGMPMEASVLRAGDTYRHVSAGGGGNGDPLERDPGAVLEDVLDGKVSAGAARSSYGVVVTGEPAAVDAAATTDLRTTLRAERTRERP